jgi:hypothetical protein
MATEYVISVDGLDVQIAKLADAPASVRRAASRSINRTLDRSRTDTARQIRQEINFPASYLNPSTGRLSVTQRSSPSDLTGKVTGRFRPTSLARFVQGSPKRGQEVPVQVDPGKTIRLAKAFIIPLKAGSASLDTKANLGLAVRTGGKPLRQSRAAKRLAPGLYLLYGPSVSQAFGQIIDNGGAEDAADYFEQEFLRQLEL